jgi:speckle-type POZ protein
MFADVQLKTNDGDVLKANKTILSIRSPVFKAMLSKDAQPDSDSVEISDFNSKTLREVLRFIYCNEVEDLDGISRDLIYAAEKYQLEGLKKICLNSIIKSLSNNNIVESLIISDRVTKSTKLFNHCLDLIHRYL